MVGFDVGQDRAVQRQLEVRAVALVGLDDEPVAVGPLRAGADVGDVAADDEARPQPAWARISISIDVVVVLPWVPATASDLALAQIDDEHAGPTEHGDPGGSRLVEFDVALPGSPSTR